MADILTEAQHRKQFGAGKSKKQWAKKYDKYVAGKTGKSTPTVQVVDQDEMSDLIDRFDDEFVADHFTVIHNGVKKTHELPNPIDQERLERNHSKAIRQIGNDGNIVRLRPVFINKTGRGLVGTSGATIGQSLLRE